MLNGVGGKVEPGETPKLAAWREVHEETTLTSGDIENFTWLGTLTIPEQCDIYHPEFVPELWFYTGRVRDESKAQKPPDETEEIAWYGLRNDDTVVTVLNRKGIYYGKQILGY